MVRALALLCVLALAGARALRSVVRMGVSKPSPAALGLRLVRGVAAASLAASVQCGDPRMVLADAPRPVLMVSSSLLTAAATQEKAPGLDALIAQAQAAYDAKRDSDFVRLKKLANDDVD